MKARPSKHNLRAFTLIELLVIIAIVAIACFLIPALVKAPRRYSRINCTNNLKQVALAFKVWAIDNADMFPMAISTNGIVTNHPASFTPPIPAHSETNGPGSKELIPSGLAYVHFQLLSNELSTPKILVCPNDKSKTVATNFAVQFNEKNVSYFVGTDAQDIYPQMFLSGDRHLAFNGKAISPGLFVLTTNNPPLSWTKANHDMSGNIGLADGSVQTISSSMLSPLASSQGFATNRLAIP